MEDAYLENDKEWWKAPFQRSTDLAQLKSVNSRDKGDPEVTGITRRSWTLGEGDIPCQV